MKHNGRENMIQTVKQPIQVKEIHKGANLSSRVFYLFSNREFYEKKKLDYPLSTSILLTKRLSHSMTMAEFITEELPYAQVARSSSLTSQELGRFIAEVTINSSNYSILFDLS